MARQRNDLQTKTVTISTTPAVRKYLSRLVSTGLYGKNPAEAAERLVAGSLERLLKDGTLTTLKRSR